MLSLILRAIAGNRWSHVAILIELVDQWHVLGIERGAEERVLQLLLTGRFQKTRELVNTYLD